jgi:hypothetical protein
VLLPTRYPHNLIWLNSHEVHLTCPTLDKTVANTLLSLKKPWPRSSKVHIKVYALYLLLVLIPLVLVLLLLLLLPVLTQLPQNQLSRLAPMLNKSESKPPSTSS